MVISCMSCTLLFGCSLLVLVHISQTATMSKPIPLHPTRMANINITDCFEVRNNKSTQNTSCIFGSSILLR